MAEKNKKILFQMVIRQPEPEKEVQYVIFDHDPTFSSLSRGQKKAFIRSEEEKIKKLISKKYRPSYF
jgi:hypothetical protein